MAEPDARAAMLAEPYLGAVQPYHNGGPAPTWVTYYEGTNMALS